MLMSDTTRSGMRPCPRNWQLETHPSTAAIGTTTAMNSSVSTVHCYFFCNSHQSINDSPQYCSMGTTTAMKSSVSTMGPVTPFLSSVSFLVL